MEVRIERQRETTYAVRGGRRTVALVPGRLCPPLRSMEHGTLLLVVQVNADNIQPLGTVINRLSDQHCYLSCLTCFCCMLPAFTCGTGHPRESCSMWCNGQHTLWLGGGLWFDSRRRLHAVSLCFFIPGNFYNSGIHFQALTFFTFTLFTFTWCHYFQSPRIQVYFINSSILQS